MGAAPKHLNSAKKYLSCFQKKKEFEPLFLVTNSITQPLEPQSAADRFPI